MAKYKFAPLADLPAFDKWFLDEVTPRIAKGKRYALSSGNGESRPKQPTEDTQSGLQHVHIHDPANVNIYRQDAEENGTSAKDPERTKSSQNAQALETPSTPQADLTKPARVTGKSKRGRPEDPEGKKKTQKRNDRLLEAWETGQYTTHAEVGVPFGMKKKAVQRAIGEAKRRRQKRTASGRV